MEDVLIHFGDTERVARGAYREFVEKGIDRGRRPDLQGGGLVRSAGGNKAGLLGRKKEEREKGDERILGSGDFVEGILRNSDKAYDRRKANRVSLEELIRKAASDVGLTMDEVRSARRNRKVSYVRTAVSYLAVTELGFSAAEVGRKLGISGMGVAKCLDRGEKWYHKEGVISRYIQ